MIKCMMLLCFVWVFILSGQCQNDTIHLFAFGHSLIHHDPPKIPTPSNETTVPHWISDLAKTAGHDFAAGGQYGFLPQHAMLPPISQWGYKDVPGVWESDLDSFTNTQINSILITAGNFIQWQSPDKEYPADPGVTPINATEKIMDWVRERRPQAKIYLYENWPDMAPYLPHGFPPSSDEFEAYNNYTRDNFHDWWIDYQDALIDSRPDINVRMIPVGPIIATILVDLIPNQIPLTELYEDDAPHGRATIYFLAGMITYMAIFEEMVPATYGVPSTVHEIVAQNYEEIAGLIWSELVSFENDYGVSRVFCKEIVSLTEDLSRDLRVVPNPSDGLLNIVGLIHKEHIQIFDLKGKLVVDQLIDKENSSIDLTTIKNGIYFLKFGSDKEHIKILIQH